MENTVPPLPPKRERVQASDDSDDTSITIPDGKPTQHSSTVFARPKRVEPPASFSQEDRLAITRMLDYIADDECSEVLLNGPNEISRKVKGVRYHCPDVSFSDTAAYHNVINEVLLANTDTPDRIDYQTVVLEGQLKMESADESAPMIARIHVVAPPGVDCAKVTIAKKSRHDLNLDDLAANGTLSQASAEFLKAAARARKTLVVSGPTGAGKTTTLQAITHYFDPNERVVVVEETPELDLPLGDVVYLRATLQKPGMDPTQIFGLDFWTKQANRMRMDRVIVGETRGAEMADWLLAANSGAEGSATTLHANSPRRALDKMLGLASKAEGGTSEAQNRKEIAQTVDLVVQCGLVDNRHVVLAIEEISETVSQATSQIQTNTLFEYDKARGALVARARPSDEFLQSMVSHGVAANPAWFQAR
jgi:pilus assembly protein CpaF